MWTIAHEGLIFDNQTDLSEDLTMDDTELPNTKASAVNPV